LKRNFGVWVGLMLTPYLILWNNDALISDTKDIALCIHSEASIAGQTVPDDNA